MRKAGEGRAQPAQGPASFVLTPYLGLLDSLGQVTPVPGCFYPSLWCLLAGCAFWLPSSLSPASPHLTQPSAFQGAPRPRLQTHSWAARTFQFKVIAVSLLQKYGESSRSLDIPKLGAEVATPPLPEFYAVTLLSQLRPCSDTSKSPALLCSAFRILATQLPPSELPWKGAKNTSSYLRL